MPFGIRWFNITSKHGAHYSLWVSSQIPDAVCTSTLLPCCPCRIRIQDISASVVLQYGFWPCSPLTSVSSESSPPFFAWHTGKPDFPEKVHVHGFHHSKAMYMLAAGIHIVYIRNFLGHEDISTTMIYSRANNRLKNKAINKLVPKVTEDAGFQDWTKNHDLLTFLNSLK